jgi:serine/threonine-protein kinase
VATLEALLEAEVPAPSTIVPDYPRALEDIVLRCLRRDPDARWQTADQIGAALESFANEHGIAPTSAAIARAMDAWCPSEDATAADDDDLQATTPEVRSLGSTLAALEVETTDTSATVATPTPIPEPAVLHAFGARAPSSWRSRLVVFSAFCTSLGIAIGIAVVSSSRGDAGAIDELFSERELGVPTAITITSTPADPGSVTTVEAGATVVIDPEPPVAAPPERAHRKHRHRSRRDAAREVIVVDDATNTGWDSGSPFMPVRVP